MLCSLPEEVPWSRRLDQAVPWSGWLVMERRVRCRMKTTRVQTFSGRREEAGMPENCHWTEVGRLYLLYICTRCAH